MMKSTIGSLGLYSDGFEPSMTPPCEGARSAEVVASAAAEVTLERISEVVVVAIASGLKLGDSLAESQAWRRGRRGYGGETKVENWGKNGGEAIMSVSRAMKLARSL